MMIYTEDLAPLTKETYQVWVSSPEDGLYAYMENLTRRGATSYVTHLNTTRLLPLDIPVGSTMFAVQATTTFVPIS